MAVTVRLVYPHQLFDAHLEVPQGTRVVLVEDDLLFRQYAFHAHKLVLHRASMRRFARRLRGAGLEVDVVESRADEPTGPRLSALIREIGPDRVEVFDVHDDWLSRDITTALHDGGYDLRTQDVLETPGFLTTREELRGWFAEHPARMQHFYTWQRRRLGVLVDGDQPVGGRWSFDTENRKKLPKGYDPPRVDLATEHGADVRAAVEWVAQEFPDAPGDPATFAWPTDAAEARDHLAAFLDERLADFGPYEDAISADHPFVHHALITPMLNIGLITPREVLDAVLAHADEHDVPIASLEGFVRQVIGWREYMRATYHLYGRRMRTSNRLHHDEDLAPGWWDASTGLLPVDLVVQRVLDNGYCHHIERLMVLGNAMCLLRVRPDAAYEWFMKLFVDAYDWVMVPNVYAMSQFAAGEAMTTKPYVSGSNYLKKMSDLPPGEWRDDWDALYWTFVVDHREVFEENFRSRRIPALWDGFAQAKQDDLLERGRALLG
ncbi:cryptochrome/photolyase family protein [Janibacter melonis]|uniref:cryptochrome/photolyase family protein n=1 Tax=Janibacter melonis TaxID=262209 RepID=UPI002044576D|nr:cryptochrome/photolyase family protein [Janibacter melonis]MCM3553644.1 cryptochrome/photolyase family protein [Janibacter melonis]